MRIDVSGGNERTKRTTCFCVEESTVNENSRIELTSASVFWDPEFYVGINYGWYKKY